MQNHLTFLHSDWKGNDCIRKLRCHCIQILHSDIYSVPFRTSRRSSRTKNIHSLQSIQAKTLWFWCARFSFWVHWRHMQVWRGIYWDVVYQQRSLNTWSISSETAILMLLWHVIRRTLQLCILCKPSQKILNSCVNFFVIFKHLCSS